MLATRIAFSLLLLIRLPSGRIIATGSTNNGDTQHLLIELDVEKKTATKIGASLFVLATALTDPGLKKFSCPNIRNLI